MDAEKNCWFFLHTLLGIVFFFNYTSTEYPKITASKAVIFLWICCQNHVPWVYAEWGPRGAGSPLKCFFCVFVHFTWKNYLLLVGLYGMASKWIAVHVPVTYRIGIIKFINQSTKLKCLVFSCKPNKFITSHIKIRDPWYIQSFYIAGPVSSFTCSRPFL